MSNTQTNLSIIVIIIVAVLKEMTKVYAVLVVCLYTAQHDSRHTLI